MKTNEEAEIDPVEKADLPTGRYPGGFRRGAGSGRRRILGPERRANRYHVMSRTAGGVMLFGEVEKEAFCRVMLRLERFAAQEKSPGKQRLNHVAEDDFRSRRAADVAHADKQDPGGFR